MIRLRPFIIRTGAPAVFIGAMTVCGIVTAQEPGIDLELDEYRIVGRDTRVFTIVGDRVSTVSFRRDVLRPPEEERSIETSQGLIGEDERLWRRETRVDHGGPYFRGGILAGSRTIADAWGKGSLDGGGKAVTMEIDTRRVKENTPTNRAPVNDDLSAVGYFGTTRTRLSAEFGFTGENDELLGKRYRSRKRELSLFRGGASLRCSPGSSWDICAKGSFTGGTYRDGELQSEDDELIASGSVSLERDAFGATVRLRGEGDRLSFGGVNGSYLASGADVTMLLFDAVGLTLGASAFMSGVEDADKEFRPYLTAKIDWVLSKNTFLKASYAPRVRRYAHRDLYAANGLVLPAVPLFFEDTPVDVAGEFGWRFRPGSIITLGSFYRKTDGALVFTRAGDFFGVVDDAGVHVRGFEVKARWDRDGRWGFDGAATLKSASWDVDGGDVPYIPGFEADLHGYLKIVETLRMTGRVSFYGEHRVDGAVDDTADGFVKIDCGIERDFIDLFDLWFEIRNITGSEGAWWTDDYLIPGIGLHAGIQSVF